MAALARAGLPTPAILVSSEEPVLDGRPFVVMEKVDGVRIEQAVETSAPRELLVRAFATARAIHELTPAQAGIEGEPNYGPAEEVGRWQALRLRTTAVRLPTTPVHRPELGRVSGHARDLSRSGFEATLDPSALCGRRGWRDGRWKLFVYTRAGNGWTVKLLQP